MRHDVTDVLDWVQVRKTGRPVHSINAFIMQALLTHLSHMRPSIFMHQKEPRTHCTSIWSHNGSEDLIPFSMAYPDSRLSHVLSVNLLSSVKSTGRQWRFFQFWCSLANANRPVQCRTVSTSPTCGHQALIPPLWSLFLPV